MAEQNSDDTRSAAARRGARPFAGPSGGPAGTSTAARPPILRAPAAGGRPARTGLAPAPVAGRPSLGAPRATTPAKVSLALPAAVPDALTSQVTAEPAAAPVEPIETPTEPTDYFAEASRADAGADEAAVGDGAPLSLLDVPSLGSGIDAQQLWGDEIISLPASPINAPPGSRMIDANQSIELEPTPAPSGLGIEHDGAQEIPAPVDGTECAAVPDAIATDIDVNWGDVPSIPSADEVIGAEPASVEALGQAITTPEEAANGGDDTVANETVPDADELAEDHARRDAWPDPLVREYAAYAAVPEALGWTLGTLEPEPPEASALADATADTPIRSEFALPDAVPTHEVRIAATLDRLAERIRGGEIDVSSVAPEATEAAVLASVLAALLRGSSTR